ncbi:hypothetical protein BU16DRAFT_31952 [Lophium mytilinum]|uniref:Mid2 domain-containing protein n=1 Tax=Lophium mytilinum TaxID=390894 RepID=A0A6A6REI2_9PEZI|nr:hypothetical protein BU16DRAFT_31952 [Lophium mytilinum]
MEHPSKRQKLSRVQAPYRRAFDAGKLPKVNDVAALEIPLSKQGSEPPIEHQRESFLSREMKGHRAVGDMHDMHRRMHQRRQLALPSELTVIVNVIATVDQNGNTVGVETVTPTSTGTSAASIASALAVPSLSSVAVIPSVPAVPAFPSDLTVPAVPPFPSLSLPSVPAYPFTSTAGSAVSVQIQGSQVVLSSPPLTFSPATTSLPGTISTSNSANSTNSSSTSSSTVVSVADFSSFSGNSSSASSSTSFSVDLNSTILSTSRLTSTSQDSSSQSSQTTGSTSQQVSSATTSAFGGGGGVGPGGTGTASSTPTAAAGNGDGGSSDNNSVSTPKVVGGVIGSLAGLAILLVIALFLLRQYKRKRQGAIQLSTTNDTTDTGPVALAGQPMAQQISFMPVAAASFLSRFSGSSKGTAETGGAGQERGFQKISGRKLPSAFSEGMTSDAVPFDRSTLSGSSFYRDSQGFYGGPGVPVGAAAVGGITEEKMMPSPARTPVIHHPDEDPPFRDGPSPPHSPVPLPLGTLGRSHPSHDGSRGSKFTEDV